MTNISAIEAVLKKYQESFHRVVRFNPEKEKIIALNFTESNKDLTDSVISDTQLFCNYINDQLHAAEAKFGIGGFGEHRTVYSRSTVFDGKDPGEEPRRLHLGIDIWSKPNTPVIAPLDGIVHSYGYNSEAGDYGGTIILTHHLDDCSFYTLYGHLSLNSIKNMQPGEHIEKGDLFAEFGIPSENGSWPPHLHFQVMIDMGERKGDYPGVCKFSEKENWLANCPDPDLILQLNQYIA